MGRQVAGHLFYQSLRQNTFKEASGTSAAPSQDVRPAFAGNQRLPPLANHLVLAATSLLAFVVYVYQHSQKRFLVGQRRALFAIHFHQQCPRNHDITAIQQIDFHRFKCIFFLNIFLRHFLDTLCAIVLHCGTAFYKSFAPPFAPPNGHNITNKKIRYTIRISKGKDFEKNRRKPRKNGEATKRMMR